MALWWAGWPSLLQLDLVASSSPSAIAQVLGGGEGANQAGQVQLGLTAPRIIKVIFHPSHDDLGTPPTRRPCSCKKNQQAASALTFARVEALCVQVLHKSPLSSLEGVTIQVAIQKEKQPPNNQSNTKQKPQIPKQHRTKPQNHQRKEATCCATHVAM